MNVAVVQMGATADKSYNLKKAVDFIRRAADRRAQFIVLPEVFIFRAAANCDRAVAIGRTGRVIAETIPGASTKPLMALAKKYKIFILAGSIYEQVAATGSMRGGAGKTYNTSALIDDRGFIKAKYRKIHLFEAVLGARHIRETDCFVAGRRAVTARVQEFKIGLSICYDLRFPEMYRRYAASGVQAVCVPSAFTHETGKAHWEVLLRARAIENRCYVLAPNQVGRAGQGVRHYGHSMIIGPWGEILAAASGNKEEIIYGQLKLTDVKAARLKLPALM